MSEPKVAPIKPEEALQLKRLMIPDFVFAVFNQLIARDINSVGIAIVKQDEAVSEILKACEADPSITRDTIFKNGWLDVEDAYREAGWKVKYDKPCYNEDYAAFFEFNGRKR